jgi:hypothetical protein
MITDALVVMPAAQLRQLITDAVAAGLAGATTTSGAPDGWACGDKAAEIAGVGYYTLYRMALAGEVPAHCFQKRGNRTYFSKRWLAAVRA